MSFQIDNIPSKNKYIKCNIKNTLGIITPQTKDDFSTNSFSLSRHKKNSQEKSEKGLTNENTTNKTSSNIIPLNTNQLYIKKIKYDYSEILIPCKPILNITASKNIMKEYSKSQKYKEDKLFLLSSKEEIETQKHSKKYEKKEEIPIKIEIESEIDEFEEILKYQETHLPVPLSKKDNETFKILKMKQMKRISLPPNKSAKKFDEDKEPLYEKEFRILNAFSTMKKRKPIHSTRRIYSSNFVLHKKKGITENFMIFRDKDIGIYEYWQTHIHEAHNDEDVETDEEQKEVAHNFCISEVKEGFEYIKNNGNEAFVNFNRYGNLIHKNKAKEIMDLIEHNLDNLILSKAPKRTD